MDDIIDAAVDAMRDDPFQDDIPLMGTSQQDARMDHYARAAIAAIMPAIGERMAVCAEGNDHFPQEGMAIASELRALASTMAEEVGK